MGDEDWDLEFEDGDGGGRAEDALRRRGKVLKVVGSTACPRAWFAPSAATALTWLSIRTGSGCVVTAASVKHYYFAMKSSHAMVRLESVAHTGTV